jgi:hypothetical protein
MSTSWHKERQVTGKLQEALFGVHRVPEGGIEITESSPTSLSSEELASLRQQATSELKDAESEKSEHPGGAQTA